MVEVVKQLKWPKGSAQLVFYPSTEVYALRVHINGRQVSHSELKGYKALEAYQAFYIFKEKMETTINDAIYASVSKKK